MAKKTGRQASRREKVEQMRSEQSRKERRSKLLLIGGTGLALILIASGVTWVLISQPKEARIADVQPSDDLTGRHVTIPAAITVLPPVGGEHSGTVQNCGVYSTPVGTENAVHSLEHGGVWITYQPNLPAADVSELAAYADGQTHILVSPYPNLPTPVVATAWGQQIELSGATDPQLATFVEQYQNGPQTPEPGAPCSGGTGTPDKS